MMGKYGEPWRQKGEACIVNCDGDEIYCGEPYVAYGFATAALEKHAVDCVNALSGLANPAAVGELVAAVENIKRNARHMNSLGTEWKVSGDDLAAIEAALAACKGGE